MKNTPFIYVFAGDDEFALDESAKGLIKILLKPGEEVFGLETIDARSDNAQQAVDALKKCREALGTVAFLGSGRVVWLRNVNFLSKTQVGRAKDAVAAVDGFAGFLKGGLPSGNKLIVTASSFDPAGALYKVCVGQDAQIAVGESSAKPYQLAARARATATRAAQSAGLVMSNDVLNAFVEKAGSDSRFIANEIEKLSLFLGTRKTVTGEDIRAVTSGGKEVATWDLEDAVCNGDLPTALVLLRQLLLEGAFPVALLMSLERRFNHLILFRQAVDRGWVTIKGSDQWKQLEWRLPEDVKTTMSALGKDDPVAMNKWRAGRLADQAQGMSMIRLRRGRELIMKAHEMLVSQSTPPVSILELLLMNLVGTAHSR